MMSLEDPCARLRSLKYTRGSYCSLQWTKVPISPRTLFPMPDNRLVLYMTLSIPKDFYP